MNALDILKHCKAAHHDIENIRQLIDRKRDVLSALPTLKTDDTGGSHTKADKDKIGQILSDIDLLEREIQTREAERDAESIAAVTFLDRLPAIESKILFEYYIKRRSTEEIAAKNNYTGGYVRKAKRTGEKKLEFVEFENIKYLFPDWYINGESAT